MTFNGTSQYLCTDANNDATCDIDTDFNLSTFSYTIQMWFKHTAGTVTGVDTLFAKCYTTTPAAATGCTAAAMNSSGFIVVTWDDDALWSIGAATNNDFTQTSTQAYNDGQWHYFVNTRTTGAGAMQTFIDGKAIGTSTVTNTTLDGSQIIGIGSDCSTGAACGTGGNFWDGSTDDIVWSANATGANDQRRNRSTVSTMTPDQRSTERLLL